MNKGHKSKDVESAIGILFIGIHGHGMYNLVIISIIFDHLIKVRSHYVWNTVGIELNYMALSLNLGINQILFQVKKLPRLKTINYHGAILLKTLFEFENPKVFARSLLSLLPEEMVTLACDQMGSYTLESFIKSSAVASKKKQAFVDKMKVNNVF